jgi:hypothetical protein
VVRINPIIFGVPKIEVLLYEEDLIMPRHSLLILSISLLLMVYSVPQNPNPSLDRGKYLVLASYTDTINDIAVTINLSRSIDSTFYLEATFTPPSGYHLYSKDLSPTGTNGQGRPTLLELPPNSRMQSVGKVTESESSEMVGYEPDGPLVYPDGPVTLSLPIKLPYVNGWVKDQIRLTYTACSALSCKIPTIGKLIPVQIPGLLSLKP